MEWIVIRHSWAPGDLKLSLREVRDKYRELSGCADARVIYPTCYYMIEEVFKQKHHETVIIM